MLPFFSVNNCRRPENEVDAVFTDRWSPRSFYKKSLTTFQIKALFEAAKWAPSCYNEQPWLFIYALKELDKKVFLSLLHKKNKLWASNAPLLIFALTRLSFESNGKRNKHSLFDLGAAWLSIALQARRMGLYAHAMAGFDQKRAYDVLGVNEQKYDITVAIAVGYCGNLNDLPMEFQGIEHPSNRKTLESVVFEGFPLSKSGR